ncbi:MULTISPECIES: YbaB/EbfC family nucleoid-associated protein [Actinoplanes]|uniref:YbaB/EbfC family nucleoid-associated protein n=1 Tax=Actinoplanes TaxID=1865 RepID=UPI000A8001B1|nr:MULTISPECIES: YbaB/EbfC family nucleoid-associated protein [Actinoplanes]GLY02144.1 hypothetical protein Acsp01_25230 [Actinoplanes sp. NBRC 101535]
MSDAETLLDPEESWDRVAAWKAGIDDLAARTKVMSERVGELTVSATDHRRIVEVTVDAQGALVDIRFGSSLHGYPPETVGRVVMETVADARREIVRRARRIVGETIGDDSAVGAAIVDRLARSPQGASGWPSDHDGRLRDERSGEW